MSRLYETKINEKRWKIVEIDNENYHSYKLIDKEKEEIYFLNHIIGVEQVADDEFLVYRRANYDEFEIVRYKLQQSKFIKVFEKKFSQFEFISDDRIIFNHWGNSGPYRCVGIYSIKENKILEEAKWLEGAAIDIYHDDENPEKKVLYVEEEIFSYKLGDKKILFTVDPKTLQPSSDCYSELRNSYIPVNNKNDIDNIKSEDEASIRNLEDDIFKQKKEQLQKAKQKILVRQNLKQNS